MTDGPDVGPAESERPTEPALPRGRSRWRRRGLLVFIGALALLLGGFGGITGYLYSLNLKVETNVKRDKLFMPPDTPESPRPPRAGNDALNVLLVGSDKRTGADADSAEAGARSDTIMIAHITAERDKIYLVSFPRDSYVAIPGHGRNKINAAFAFGGAGLLVQTLEKLTAVHIDHVAVVGFEGFRDLTVALGGVEVDVVKASSIPGTPYRWEAGVNRMQGEEALMFVRQRYGLSGGDLDRVRRQQAFVKAIMLKVLSRDTLTDPRKLSKVVSTGTKNLTVDEGFSTGQLRSLALSLRNVRGDDITFITAPVAGLGRSPAGASIVNLDTDRMAQLSKDLRQDQMMNYRPE